MGPTCRGWAEPQNQSMAEQRDGEAVSFRAAEPGGQGRGRLDRLLLWLHRGGRRAGVGRALDEAVLALGVEVVGRGRVR